MISMARRKMKRVYAILIVLVFSLGFLLGLQWNRTSITYINETRPIHTISYDPLDPYTNSTTSMIMIPAVDQEGEGVTTVLYVQVLRGTGRILANIDRLLFWTDTQNSIRTARSVASEITGKNLSDYDIVYTIETEATTVEGPSAGTALAIATIAALEGKKINGSVMITGAINHDGTIGPVGGVLPKAMAAKEAGSQLFLVPLLHSSQVTYRTKRYCEDIGISQICTTERIPEKVTVAEEAGIRVIEVESVEEALEYFLIE